MISYKDKTFCSLYITSCINHNCSRAFTKEEQTNACQWWNDYTRAVPIAYSNCKTDTCGFISKVDK